MPVCPHPYPFPALARCPVTMNIHPPDEPLGDGDHADVAARLHAALSGPSLDSATRQRHLHAIRTRVATLPAPAPAPTPAPVTAAGGLGRRLASTVTAAGLVVVMGASGAVAASHDSLPGQAMYPVKQVTEQLVLAAPLPTEHAVERHLTFADRRLDEAAALADRDADPDLVAQAIAAHARLLARADELAGDDIQLTGRVDAATGVAQRRLAHLLDQGLPEVAARQARAALSAAEARLERRHAPPPATPQAPSPPVTPRAPATPGAPEHRPQPPASQPPPERTPPPAPGPRPTPGPHAEPGPPAENPGRQPAQPDPTTPAPSAPQGGPSGAPGPDGPEGNVQGYGADQAPTDRAQSGEAQPPPDTTPR